MDSEAPQNQAGLDAPSKPSQTGSHSPQIMPDIPAPDLDFSSSLEGILGKDDSSSAELEKVHKRASNVMKLAQENEKLEAELKAMQERLEAAERRRAELEKRNAEA